MSPPLPGPPLLRQRWLDVTFMHWRVDVERAAAQLPAGLRPHQLDGETYVGLVCFRLVGAGLARGPALLRPFVETNVRLYAVDERGRAGVVFLSMDVSSAMMAASGRAVGLPYRWARAAHRRTGAGHAYVTLLPRSGEPRLRSRLSIRPVDGVALEHDELARFLTERWALFAPRLGRTWHLPNTHEAWPLRAATVTTLDDDLVPAAGFPEVAGRPPDHVAFSPGVSARFGSPAAL
ncbi:YqjF family protein [Pseudactinotalea suaedae]|uniref:YqjF family protein n=1 Tax=Pseudactinotalea suaedae TaxID=1524924 RepID=UPI001F4FFA3E|nr:DUF2071 domain-containing protein [Pseudactinotalea suaedae]